MYEFELNNQVENLKKEFLNTNITFGNEILKFLSTKTDKNQIFPPYIPFIGKNYNQYKILIYSTAQNIDYVSAP